MIACDCEVCTAKRKYKLLLSKAEKRQPKFYELDWDFMSVEGISKIAEKFEQLVGKIAIELKEQSQLARMHIFTFDSQFATNKYREIEQEHFNVLNSIGIDFMTLLSDSFARKPLSSLDIEHSIAKIVLKSQPILLQICQKSAASWFDLCKLYNANVTIIELHNLAVEYFQIMNDICEKLEFHRHSMIGSFKKILVKAQALKSSLFELTQNLSKFSNTRTATEQLSSNAVDKYFRDEINFKFEVQSDLISLLASELFASLNSNHVACLFALSLIKEDNGYYSSKLLEGENKYVHICLGDTAVSAAINKIVVQKEQFIDCTI